MKRNREIIPQCFLTALSVSCSRYAQEAGAKLSEVDGWPVLTHKDRSVMVKITRYRLLAGQLLNSSMEVNKWNFVYLLHVEDIFDYPRVREELSLVLRQSSYIKEKDRPTFYLVQPFLDRLREDKCLYLDRGFHETYSPSKAYYWFIEIGFNLYMFTIRTANDWWFFNPCEIRLHKAEQRRARSPKPATGGLEKEGQMV